MIIMEKWFCTTALVFLALFSFSQKPPTFSTSGKAIRGYDPVAYFTYAKPVEGKDDLVYNWNGANWHFATQAHLDSFKLDPVKYAPQYGGYCAYGLSNGYKASTSPDAWTIENGKLYLNYNIKVRELWDQERKQRIELADKNWPSVKDN
jgi:YHS domain-containing protein